MPWYILRTPILTQIWPSRKTDPRSISILQAMTACRYRPGAQMSMWRTSFAIQATESGL
jgi:hypothetical protein